MLAYEITEHVRNFEEVRVCGERAYEGANFSAVCHLRAGGLELRERSRLFRVLRRQPDGSWKVRRSISHDLPA